jgi:nucleoside-diphosphate-sugar epimerase
VRLFQSIANNKFMMVGQGFNLRSAVYITDFLDALELCATRQGIDGEAFIITHDELVTVAQIVEEVAHLVGASVPRFFIPVWFAWGIAGLLEGVARIFKKQPPITRRSLKFFTNDAGFTCEKARRILGFEPQVSLRDGLDLTYRWWCKNIGGK